MKTKVKYSIDYFIKKFTDTDPSQWTRCQLTNSNGQHCALGFCGGYDTKEAQALKDLTKHPSRLNPTYSNNVMDINDSQISYRHLGKDPRTRVINALKRIKRGWKVVPK